MAGPYRPVLMNVTFLRGDDAMIPSLIAEMSSEEISTVRFAVFVQGRGLRDWEWKSVELLRAGGASCLFILVPPDAAPRRPSAARALDGLVLRIAGLPAEVRPRSRGAGPSMLSAIDDLRHPAHSCRRAGP